MKLIKTPAGFAVQQDVCSVSVDGNWITTLPDFEWSNSCVAGDNIVRGFSISPFATRLLKAVRKPEIRPDKNLDLLGIEGRHLGICGKRCPRSFVKEDVIHEIHQYLGDQEGVRFRRCHPLDILDLIRVGVILGFNTRFALFLSEPIQFQGRDYLIKMEKVVDLDSSRYRMSAVALVKDGDMIDENMTLFFRIDINQS